MLPKTLGDSAIMKMYFNYFKDLIFLKGHAEI